MADDELLREPPPGAAVLLWTRAVLSKIRVVRPEAERHRIRLRLADDVPRRTGRIGARPVLSVLLLMSTAVSVLGQPPLTDPNPPRFRPPPPIPQQTMDGRSGVPTHVVPELRDEASESPGLSGELPGGSFMSGDEDLRPLTETLSLNTTPRELSLRAAIEISLTKSDIVRTLSGDGVQIADVTRYDPAIFQARSDAASAVFDPRFSAGYVGSRVDEPPSAFYGPGIPLNTRRDEGDFIASLSKTWMTGATTRVGYLPPLGYLYFPNGALRQFNPIYSSDLVLDVRQPLLRGAGLTVNTAPLRIAQMRTQQSAWECKQAILAQVRSVEEAYWDLQAALATLDAMEFVLPLVGEVVRIERHRAQSERAIRADVARASIQFDQFQQERLQSRNNVVEKELRLRNLLGLELADGTRLLPTDPPRRTTVVLSHASAVANAIENRPDLVQQRLGVQIRELEYAVARNGTRPQLDLQALYRSSGVGQGLDHALQQMSDFQYSSWTLGLTFSVPLGNRAARASLRAVELQLTRDRAVLQQTIQNIGYRLADLIREAETAFEQYELALRRVQNGQEWLQAARVRFANPPPSGSSQDWLLLALYDYQMALRMHVEATTDAGLLLARYNTQLARLEEAQGILLENRGIELTDDPCEIVQRHSQAIFATNPQTQTDPRSREFTHAAEPNVPAGPYTHATRYSEPRAGGGTLPQPGHSPWGTSPASSNDRVARPPNYSAFRPSATTPPPGSPGTSYHQNSVRK